MKTTADTTNQSRQLEIPKSHTNKYKTNVIDLDKLVPSATVTRTTPTQQNSYKYNSSNFTPITKQYVSNPYSFTEVSNYTAYNSSNYNDDDYVTPKKDTETYHKPSSCNHVNNHHTHDDSNGSRHKHHDVSSHDYGSSSHHHGSSAYDYGSNHNGSSSNDYGGGSSSNDYSGGSSSNDYGGSSSSNNDNCNNE